MKKAKYSTNICFVLEYLSDSSSNEEFFISSDKALRYNSPDSDKNFLPLPSNSNLPASSNTVDVKRYPSPYYYADLYKSKQDDASASTNKQEINAGKESVHQETPKSSDKEDTTQNEKKHSSHRKYKRSYSLETARSDVKTKTNPRQCCNFDTQSTDSSNLRLPDYNTDVETKINDPIDENSPHGPVFSSEFVLNDDDMTRKRHLYETAFDCSITQTEGDVDQLDKVSNHPVLVQLTSNRTTHTSASSSTDCDTQNCKVISI